MSLTQVSLSNPLAHFAETITIRLVFDLCFRQSLAMVGEMGFYSGGCGRTNQI